MPDDAPTSTIPCGPLPPAVQTDMQCPVVYPHQYTPTSSSLLMRIDDHIYDLTKWRSVHPGGGAILDLMHMKDATDAFYALHSPDAIAKLKVLQRKPCDDTLIPRDEISVSFEKLRKRLEAEGWFKRDWGVETVRYIIPATLFILSGIYLAWSWPVLATLLLGLGMQQAGWISHDFSHGRDTTGMQLGSWITTCLNGFSNGWWSNKHNTHHVFPNRIGVDSDIHNDPHLHLWFPTPEADVWFRRYQHLYYPFLYCFLVASWRAQSAYFAFTTKGWTEKVCIFLSYCWLLCLPLPVVIGSILFTGFGIAIVVTANHQVEDLLGPETHYNFIADQYITTRGVVCPDFFTEMFFGGMQYQLEHHLFPIMPRSRYAKLRPIVTQFAKENGLEHKLSGVRDILYRNYLVMKRAAAANPPQNVKKY